MAEAIDSAYQDAKHRIDAVQLFLHSCGGDSRSTAATVGVLQRMQENAKLTTVVAPGSTCASACVASCVVGGQLRQHSRAQLIVRSRRNLGLVDAARHADAIMLLARRGDTQRLRKRARPRRLLGNFARLHLGLLCLQPDFARRAQSIDGFCRAEQKRRRTVFGLQSVAREEKVARVARRAVFRYLRATVCCLRPRGSARPARSVVSAGARPAVRITLPRSPRHVCRA